MKKNKTSYVDLHCHPFKEYFENNDEIILNAQKKGVDKIFIVGTSIEDSLEVKNIVKKHKNLFPIIGIHPNNAWDEEIINQLENLVDEDVVGIGEVGLDYHYENNPSKEIQKKCFKKQIEIAIKNKIPVIVHSRDAHQDTYTIIREYRKKYKDLIFILHSYSSGLEYMKKYLNLGNIYFSFSGIVTFKNAKETQDAANYVPLENIFCETDTPYLTPTPYRGKINLPEYVIETTKFIANLRNIDIKILLENININVKNCFKKIY